MGRVEFVKSRAQPLRLGTVFPKDGEFVRCPGNEILVPVADDALFGIGQRGQEVCGCSTRRLHEADLDEVVGSGRDRTIKYLAAFVQKDNVVEALLMKLVDARGWCKEG